MGYFLSSSASGGEGLESLEYCRGTSLTGLRGLSGECDGDVALLGVESGERGPAGPLCGVPGGDFQGVGGLSKSILNLGWCLSMAWKRGSVCLMVARMSPSDLLGGRLLWLE